MNNSKTVGLFLAEDGSLADVSLNTEKDGSNLDEMYRLLGTRTVDVLRLPHNIDLWVDDEALVKGNPSINVPLALTFALMVGADDMPVLCGAGLFLTFNDEGESISLTEEQKQVVREHHALTYSPAFRFHTGG